MRRSLLTHGSLLAVIGVLAGFFASYVDQHPRLQNFIDQEAIAIRALGFSCGVERWGVKTLADAQAGAVSFASPIDTTIAALSARRSDQPASRELVSPDPGAGPNVETTVWRLGAHVIAFKQEADSDIHLELSDGAGHTMIAEMPLQSCITPASEPVIRAEQLATGTARAAFESYLSAHGIQVSGSYQTVDIPATLTGAGFFDFAHGQRGVAPNAIELHPVLSFSAGGTPSPPPPTTVAPPPTTAPGTTTTPKPPPPPPAKGDDALDEAPGCATYPHRIYYHGIRQSHCSARYYTTP